MIKMAILVNVQRAIQGDLLCISDSVIKIPGQESQDYSML